MSVVYKYALDSNNAIVNISDLSSNNQCKKQPFFCISCGCQLIPHLGSIKEKHFQHKSKSECAAESYLHKTAKYIFAKSFNEAVEQGQPVSFPYVVKSECVGLSDVKPMLCKKSIEKVMDLTSIFTIATIEKSVEVFRADVLLHNHVDERCCMVEIHVTNGCSGEKTSSGIPIIEIFIEKYDDLQYLEKVDICLIQEHLKVSIKGLKTKTVRGDFCQGECVQRASFSAIYKDGSFHVGEGSLKALNKHIRSESVLFWRFIEPSGYNNEVSCLVEIAKTYSKTLRCCHTCMHGFMFERGRVYCLEKSHFVASRKNQDCSIYEMKDI